MNLEQFIVKYIGQYIEAGGTTDALNQCVDLINQYLDEILKFPKILWTNAIDYPSKAGNNYDWIINTPEGVPQKGDLVIFNIGQYGHISICLLGDTNQIVTFDQNFPIGSKCALRTHNYTNVVGWLHPKISPNSGSATPEIPQYFGTLLAENNLSLKNESQIRQWFEQARKYPGLLEDVTNSTADNDKLHKLINQLTNDLNSCLTKTKEAPKPSDNEEMDSLLAKLFKKLHELWNYK